MYPHRLIPAAALSAAFLLAAPLAAQQDTSAAHRDSTSTDTLGYAPKKAAGNESASMADRAFIRKAAGGDSMEVALGQLAQTHASSRAVKEFGQRMIRDHSPAQQKLREVATQVGYQAPDSLTDEQRAHVDSLSNLQGAAFDSAYMRLMVKDHHEDVEHFKQEARSAGAAPLKKLARQTVPTLEQHLTLAKKTAREIGLDPQQILKEQEAGESEKADSARKSEERTESPAEETREHSHRPGAADTSRADSTQP